MKDLGVVFALIPALPQVVEIQVEGGGAARSPADHLGPGTGPGALAYRAAVQPELAGCGQAAAVSGGDFLNASGQALPQVERSLTWRAPGAPSAMPCR
ncbi:hypothetical protein GCM10027073_56800 [Streptomyces chlorus]